MPKKAKTPLSGPLGGGSPSSPIAPSAPPHLAEVAAGAELRSPGILRRPRDVHHDGVHNAGVHPPDGFHNAGVHFGKHDSNRTQFQRRENRDLPQGPKAEEFEFIPGPKLRAKLGISAVTLWRWRHDKE